MAPYEIASGVFLTFGLLVILICILRNENDIYDDYDEFDEFEDEEDNYDWWK